MITSIRIQNYRSFVDAEVKLRPFSLVVGANGSGKSNLFKAIAITSGVRSNPTWQRHVNHIKEHAFIAFTLNNGQVFKLSFDTAGNVPQGVSGLPWAKRAITPFNINADLVSSSESIISNPNVQPSGAGTVQVLEHLKNGDREDLFDKIEENFKRYVPEVEKLSLRTTAQGTKQIQVRERGLNELLPATELSEGTRLILCILTIIHQEKPPPIILLEDIDRGLHPRLFEYMASLMKDIAERHNINILATTHNPYLVDCFKDDKEAVIIVEKKDGASTLSTLADRLEGLDYDSVDPDDMPLGNLWFSGLVGGVPAKITRRPEK